MNPAMDKGLPAILITRARLAEGAVDWTGTLPLHEDWGAGDAELADPPRGTFRVDESRNGSIRVTGQVTGTVVARCRRCLRADTRDLQVAVDFRLEPSVDAWDEAPGLYTLDDQLDTVDLLPALREELLLGLPDFPVCRPDCRGLCDVCGMDQNEGVCNCKTQTMDPRWESLRQIAGSPKVDEDQNQEGQ